MRPFLAAILFAVAVFAAVPTPTEHLGYQPGADYKLADYGEISSYFQKLEKSSNRIKLAEFGRTSSGKPMLMAFLSSPENLKHLEKYKEINRKLALGKATPEEAAKLAKEGKVFVWIDAGMHSSEAACAQGSFDLAYRMVTEDTDEYRRIRDNVILIQVPVLNPDGHDLIVNWFRQNAGTKHEAANLPVLYQKYAGHDNNRDYFMFNLTETQHVGRMLFQEWFPQILYNQHQAPAFPARIFTPPYAEPLNPNIPATLMEGINVIGSAMRERFARENKPGVLSYHQFDAWWDGGLRSTPAFHNMHGILTEVAMQPYAIPRDWKPSDIPERFTNGIPTQQPTVFYSLPWKGGRWGARDAIEYLLTADLAILNLAANMPHHWLSKAYDMAHQNIEAGDKQAPFAYVVPPNQWDAWTADEMVKRLLRGGLEVQRATKEIRMGEKVYPAGSYVLLAGQAFRGYLMDLMEPQNYPELRNGPTGPPKRPYDVVGWTLPMQMGVTVERVNDRFDLSGMQAVSSIQERQPILDRRDNSSFLAMAELLRNGKTLRWMNDGRIVREGEADWAKASYSVKQPKLALYEPHIANMDLGWTMWLLDSFKVPYTVIKNDDIQKGNLRARFDTILFAQQTPESIIHGLKGGDEEGGQRIDSRGAIPRPEHLGGVTIGGLSQLEDFVKGGGSLLMMSSSAELALQFLPIGIRNAARGGGNSEGGEAGPSASAFYSPGSLLRVNVDSSNPIAWGMPSEAIVFSNGGPVFETSNGATSPVKYAKKDLLASGWVSGEKGVLGKTVVAEAKYGAGRVVLYGIRPQHRGQPFGTFKLLLNAIYLGSATKLN